MSAGDAGEGSGGGSRKRRAQRSAPPARVALFRHVRFNRVHVAITYKGTYFSLNNAKARFLALLSISLSARCNELPPGIGVSRDPAFFNKTS